jgi:hypothetical protein
MKERTSKMKAFMTDEFTIPLARLTCLLVVIDTTPNPHFPTSVSASFSPEHLGIFVTYTILNI